MSNTNNIVVPNDIVIEILVRVPAKSLLRLRWACKYLFDLITRDHAFIKKNCLHYQHITTVTNTNDDRIISNTSFWISNSKTVVHTMNLGDFVNNDHDGGDDGTSVNMDCYNSPFYNFDDNDNVEFSGSCNGLVLLHSKKLHRYCLWNPCTREVRELPHEPYPVNDCYEYKRVVGFGYDHTMNDYKVVRIIFYASRKLNEYAFFPPLTMDISVYTLGSNSWSTKIVTDPLLTSYLDKQIQDPGVLVNGALHWTSEWGIGTITSFDITKEELREIEGPNKEELIETEGGEFIDYEPTFNLCLSLMNGCLCICQMPHQTDDYVIRMMKDYGVKDSWTKLFTINMEMARAASGCYGDRSSSMESFEQYYKAGEIALLVFHRKRDIIIVACDSKKNDKARFVYRIEYRDYWFVHGTYTESLVSLHSGMYLTLAVKSRILTFQKQDLLEYEIKRKSRIDKYLVRKWTKDERYSLTDDEDEYYEEYGN